MKVAIALRRRTGFALFMCLAVGFPSSAQETKGDTAAKTFFTKRDLLLSGVALGGSALLSRFDVRISRWAQSPGVQGGDGRDEVIEQFTHVNETPLTILAIATYGAGRLASSNTVADIGLHTSEALVLTVAMSELLRTPIGRIRPREALDNQYDFDFGGGFTRFEARSFPSLHASAAFATAAALSGELKIRSPRSAPYVVPVLYGAALIPGLTRIYLNEHWASDITAGAFLGALVGSRVVSYAHTHSPSRLDRALLGLMVVPNHDGGISAVVSLH